MADDSAAVVDEGGNAKCPECVPGLPGWMATFSDLVTLLLTFFVLLLSFAKTETAKYEAALGSIRNAFGGNVLQQGEVIQKGKSPDNFPTMMESQTPIKPFPIEFLTMEGILDKHEINRGSEEVLKNMRHDLKEFNLSENVTVYEQAEGIVVRVKDKIYFKRGSVEIESTKIAVSSYQRMIDLLKKRNWKVFVMGYAARGEVSNDGKSDALELSSARATAATKSLIRRGINPERISTVFYGDTRLTDLPGRSQMEIDNENRKVEFMIRKRDLEDNGHKVEAQ
ncbi:OmpA family protein [Bacteriovorax sp. BAL6_X]|uniref:flagellar motor protein MotB n=1 Tax=Bacteriovorax sp. BAL6_X TaxID=1201290 RepID=UPI000385F66A|nr:flagellar motor protein MotB [Bacteriovorax sp. BAL6_X]EPZ51695.1 OmpA family protein [Bacteriovorax sp. BAL6_X]